MQCFVTADPDFMTYIVVSFDVTDGVLEGYSQIADYLAEKQLTIVHERIFGSLLSREQTLIVRREVFEGSHLPHCNAISWIEGKPIWGKGVAGIIVKAIDAKKTDCGVEQVKDENIVIGAKWSWYGDDYLIVQNIGVDCICDSLNDYSRQTVNAIERAQRVLQSESMSFEHVARTWFYLDSILDWYDDFNVSRSQAYCKYGLMPNSKDALRLPASTGIRGKNYASSALLMDLIAIKPKIDSRCRVTQLSNTAQKDAFAYGSAFSRGAHIAYGEHSFLQLSGTASIDEYGATIHVGDVNKQIDCTVQKITQLLKQVDMGIDQLSVACVFLKDASYYEAYLNFAKKHPDLSQMPAIIMVADVCRDDLLFEIDGEGFVTSDKALTVS